MSDFDQFLLKDDEFKRALILGAIQIGAITKALGEAALLNASPDIEIKQLANGAVIDFERVIRPNANQVNVVSRPVTETHDTDHHAEGPDPVKVKEALAQAMERVPSIATIRKWDSKQRKQAMKWAKAVSHGAQGGQSQDRPEFIVEPAPRKRRKDAKTNHHEEKKAHGRHPVVITPPHTAKEGAPERPKNGMVDPSEFFKEDEAGKLDETSV